MKEIKHYVEQIRDELEVAEEYAKIAAKLKDTDPTNSAEYAEMSRQELSHVDKLHKMAVRAIEKKRSEGIAPPPAMQAVWDWEHEKMMDRVTRIKTLLSMT
jgi:hypothetical protein